MFQIQWLSLIDFYGDDVEVSALPIETSVTERVRELLCFPAFVRMLQRGSEPSRLALVDNMGHASE
jgi:hypothetical protein